MDIYRNHFVEIVKDWRYMIPTCLITAMSFGFTLGNPVISIDDTAFDIYFKNNGLIGQGRFGPAFLDKVFHIYEYTPFFLGFCAVLCLFVSAILFCILFKITSNNKLHPFSYIVFSCFMISYPLMSEIFGFMTASFSICISYIFIALSLILINAFLEHKNWVLFIISISLLIIAVSCYESFATVYICGVFAILILKFLYGDQKNRKTKVIMSNGLIFMTPLILGVEFEVVISILLLYFMDLARVGWAENSVNYATKGFIETLTLLKDSLIVNYGIAGLWYLPITMYVISVFVTLIMMFVHAIKCKNPTLLFLFLALVLSTVLLSLVQGIASPYRACQVFAFFIAFIMMLLAQNVLSLKKVPIVKYVTIILMTFMIFFQAQNLHHWFYLDYLRYTEEKNIITAVYHRLNDDFNVTKPVVFAGTISLHSVAHNKIYIPQAGNRLNLANEIKDIFLINKKLSGERFVQTNIRSIINWGNMYYWKRSETNLFGNMNGFYFEIPTSEMVNAANAYLPWMEEWPSQKSILETEEFIIVNF